MLTVRKKIQNFSHRNLIHKLTQSREDTLNWKLQQLAHLTQSTSAGYSCTWFGMSLFVFTWKAHLRDHSVLPRLHGELHFAALTHPPVSFCWMFCAPDLMVFCFLSSATCYFAFSFGLLSSAVIKTMKSHLARKASLAYKSQSQSLTKGSQDRN